MHTYDRSMSRIREQAAMWVTRLDSPTLTAIENREFECWLLADPRHEQAFVEIGTVIALIADFPEHVKDRLVSLDVPAPIGSGKPRFARLRAALLRATSLIVPCCLLTFSAPTENVTLVVTLTVGPPALATLPRQTPSPPDRPTTNSRGLF
jgi:ferric-dicitrate binding protein FerR (iron transport regulator)